MDEQLSEYTDKNWFTFGDLPKLVPPYATFWSHPSGLVEIERVVIAVTIPALPRIPQQDFYNKTIPSMTGLLIDKALEWRGANVSAFDKASERKEDGECQEGKWV